MAPLASTIAIAGRAWAGWFCQKVISAGPLGFAPTAKFAGRLPPSPPSIGGHWAHSVPGRSGKR
jgi:hypothetical protein